MSRRLKSSVQRGNSHNALLNDTVPVVSILEPHSTPSAEMNPRSPREVQEGWVNPIEGLLELMLQPVENLNPEQKEGFSHFAAQMLGHVQS